MKADTRELFRNALLMAANKAAPAGLTLESFLVSARVNGFRTATLEDVELEIEYLIEKALLVPIKKLISPEVGAWKITATGRDHLAQEGLA